MSLVKRSTCKITALNSKGLGTCTSANFSHILELPYTIPGETVEFEEHSYRGKTTLVLSKILEPSNHRTNPPCQYFGTCGGCLLQHLNEDYYLQYKLENLAKVLKLPGGNDEKKKPHDVIARSRVEALAKTDDAAIPGGESNVRHRPPEIATPPSVARNDDFQRILSIGPRTRRRAIFEAVKKRDHIFLGFKKYHSNKIVNIDHCLLLLPELSDLIAKLKVILLEFLDNQDKCKILITKATNGIDLTIEMLSSGLLPESEKTSLRGAKESINVIASDHLEAGQSQETRVMSVTSPEIATPSSMARNDDLSFCTTTPTSSHRDLTLFQNFARDNELLKLTIIDNNKWHLVYLKEQPYILFENIKVEVDNHCFLQVSEDSDKILANLINNILSDITLENNLHIADLFCGRGTLTIPATKFGSVDGYETEKASVKALNKALNESKLKATVTQRDLFTYPVQWDELTKYDVVIINPPRAGAQTQASILSTSTVKTIIYLSCNPETFARDMKIILKNERYTLKQIIPIDQFYWSPHLEVMGVFVSASS